MELFLTNDKRRIILTEILRWRYLGTLELSESLQDGTRIGPLRKLLRRMEKDGLVSSYMSAAVKRKFYYASKLTHEQYIGERKWHINEDIKAHDAILSTFLFKLSRCPNVKNPRHFEETRGRSVLNLIEPDATFELDLNGQESLCSVELELNRKSQDLIKKKFKSIYLGGASLGASPFDLVFYLFSDLNILKAYHRYHIEIVEELGIKYADLKIVFAYSDTLPSYYLNLSDIKRLTQEGEIDDLGEFFFEPFKMEPQWN